MKLKNSRGFTLMEMVVAIGIFAVLISGVIGLYAMLTKSVKAAREQTVLASLATNYLETARNMPYSEIGTASGNPPGNLADEANPISSQIESTVYQIYYEVTFIDNPADGTAGAGTDLAPNDYKQVKMFVRNTSTNVITSFITNIVPQGLEAAANAGSLAISVFDSTGQPVEGATINITNTTGTLNVNRISDSAGNWLEVSLPAGVNFYHVVVTKDGYSSDQTYPITAQNPNPIKPDPTIVNGEVTEVSFFIDRLSTLTIRTLNSTCGLLNNVSINIKGSKLIGTNPDVLEFDNTYVSSGGQIVINNLEWDVYVPTLLNGQNLMVLGTSPIQQISVLPGSNATYTFILGTQSTNSLLVIVKDASTGAAIEGANVNLHKGGSEPQDYYGTTSGSVLSQNSWTGGGGQVDFVDQSRYFADNGNVDINSNPTGVRLRKVTGRYVTPGELVSSTFDTGSTSNFTTITWLPTSQNPATTLQFQLATNNDNSTWNYVGPDGTGATYYAVGGTNISTVHDNDRYLRYKVYLSTADDKYTPVLTSLDINFVSGCYTPGQVSFGSLTAGNNYDLTVTMAGYQDLILNNLNIFGNQTVEVLMTP